MTCTRTASDLGLPVPFHDSQHASSWSLAAIVTAAAQPAAEHPDAELLDLGRRWIAVRQDCGTFDRICSAVPAEDTQAAWDDLGERENWLTEAITALPARTAEGLAVKARVLACAHDCDPYDDAGIAAWAGDVSRAGGHIDMAIGSLVRDLLRLAQTDGRLGGASAVKPAPQGASAVSTMPAGTTAPGAIERAYANHCRLMQAWDEASELETEAAKRYSRPLQPGFRFGYSAGGYGVSNWPGDHNRVVIRDDPENIAELRRLASLPYAGDQAGPAYHERLRCQAQDTLDAILSWQDECRRLRDEAGLTEAEQAREQACLVARLHMNAVLELEPTTLREAAFQAAVQREELDEQKADLILDHLTRLAGIQHYTSMVQA